MTQIYETTSLKKAIRKKPCTQMSFKKEFTLFQFVVFYLK